MVASMDNFKRSQAVKALIKIKDDFSHAQFEPNAMELKKSVLSLAQVVSDILESMPDDQVEIAERIGNKG